MERSKRERKKTASLLKARYDKGRLNKNRTPYMRSLPRFHFVGLTRCLINVVPLHDSYH